MIDPDRQKAIAEKNKQTLKLVLAGVFCMVSLAYASVPLYRLFCQVTGFAGTTMVASAPSTVVLDREIKVRFNADVSPQLDWEFKPDQGPVVVKVGEEKLISYSAKNPTDKPLVGTAIYNVAPAKMGKYFNKVQCFCFNAQQINAGQEVHMPVSFHIDPSIMDDPALADVDTVTLSYTFFKAQTQELDEALENYSNQLQNTP